MGSNQGRDYERRKTIRWKKEEKKVKRRTRKRKENKGNEKKEKKMKKGKKIRKNKREEENRALRERKKKMENDFYSQCSNGRKSLLRELKLVYSTRATSRCQKQKR